MITKLLLSKEKDTCSHYCLSTGHSFTFLVVSWQNMYVLLLVSIGFLYTKREPSKQDKCIVKALMFVLVIQQVGLGLMELPEEGLGCGWARWGVGGVEMLTKSDWWSLWRHTLCFLMFYAILTNKLQIIL